MAHIYRLICFLLLSIPVSSIASFPAPPGWDTQCVPARYPWPYQAKYPATWVCVLNPGFNTRDCGWNFQGDQGPARSVQCSQGKTPPSCPANSTLAAGQCTCSAGHRQTASNDACEPIPCEPPNEIDAQGQCKPPINDCPKSGTSAGFYVGPGRTGTKYVCSTDMRVPSRDPALPGCRLSGNSPLATGGNPPPEGDPDGWTWGAQMTYTGEKCSPIGDGDGDGGKPAPDDPQCTPPKVAGTVNGKQVCYTPSPGSPDSNKPSSSQTPPKTTTSSNPDGSKNNTTSNSKTECKDGTCTTTTTHTTSTTSPGGTTGPPVTISTTTTCKMGPGCGPIAPVTQGSTTTTNTSTNPNGSTTTTSTTTPNGGTTGAGGSGSSGSGSSGTGGDGDSEGDPSQFAGQCGAPPFCDGDAVMCAIAAATFATNCVLKDPEQPTPIYDDAKINTGDLTTG